MMMFNPPHPGEILREDYLAPLELTVTGLAKALQVSRKNLSEIVNEHTGISPQMAVRLAKAFSTTPQFWMNLQMQYDLWQAMQQGLDKQVRTLYSERADK
jgi:addiction module HigA family antidote